MPKSKIEPDAASAGPVALPGTVITPDSAPPPPASPTQTPVGLPQSEKPEQPQPVPAKQETVPEPSQAKPSEPAAPEPALATTVAATDEATAEEPTQAEQSKDGQTVTWTASEFIAHDKSAGWYVGLALGALVLGVLVYLVSRDFVSVSVVIVAAIVLGFYGSHKPRQLQYAVGLAGISIGNKHYDYDAFKSFSVMPEGAFSSVSLMPLKRFSPVITLYYAPDDEEKIMSILSTHLPNEEPRRDPVDAMMRRIRF